MKTITGLLSLLLLTGCTSGNAQEQLVGNQAPPWDEWYFAFTTPKALPAQVTLVKLLDTKGYGYVFETIDQPQGISVGKWDEQNSAGGTQFNKAKTPPQLMTFCWDSVIDKKTYETTLFFYPDTWEKMITSYPNPLAPSKKLYRQTMLIGLAPKGIVHAWLRQYGHSDILLTSTKITTVSGKELAMCKNETNFPDGYEYSEGMKTFIKDKKYPYGSW
ncbi:MULTISPECIES: DUF2931 family protein [Rahnella]|jgi:hypothetical protein|uniref:DUF2931 family protein n=1 Tax=Rahnella TaxID=34037 RepID=UPI0005689380|nr:DUF2931 family protein [Rahnella sp. WP5]AYA09902.1 DUF2931 family protein [Rahnella aquatilis]